MIAIYILRTFADALWLQKQKVAILAFHTSTQNAKNLSFRPWNFIQVAAVSLKLK